MSLHKTGFGQVPVQKIREGLFHSHPHEQITYVEEGEIIFYCEERTEQKLKRGDLFAVPSGKKHTIKILTERVRLIDSFTPLREDFLE